MTRIKVFFAWYDLWIGAYVNPLDKYIYVCPLPTLCIRIWYGRG